MSAILPPVIQAVVLDVALEAPGQWRLEVLWRFENPAEAPLWVLLAQPLATTLAEPLVLDHSARDDPSGALPNLEPRLEVVEVPPRGSAERRLVYHLAFPAGSEPRAIAGRFGYGRSAPDPEWLARQNRRRLAAWQTRADSAPVPVSFGGEKVP